MSNATIFLCCKRVKNPDKLGQGCRGVEGGALHRVGNAVRVALMPDRAGVQDSMALTLRLLPEHASEYCNMPDPGLALARAGERSGSDRVEDEDATPLPYAILQYTTPDHCHWRLSRVVTHGFDPGAGPLGRGIGGAAMPVGGGDLDEDAPIGGAGRLVRTRLDHVDIAPGEYLEPATSLWDGENGIVHHGLGGSFTMPALTGGRVLEVLGDYGRPEIRYRVGAMGPSGRIVAEHVVTPSDFVEYRVGDWVFLSPGGGDCVETMGIIDITDDSASGSIPGVAELAGCVILPLRCGRFKAESPDFQPLDMPVVTPHPMGDLLDFCLLKGAVIQVNQNGTLDVEMHWGRVTVPVHYHCPKATSVAGGHTAFQPEDEVLVVSTREQQRAHAVIGFADKKPRPCKEYLFIGCRFAHQGSVPHYFVWDPDLGGYAEDIPDGMGGVIPPSEFPCTLDKLNFWAFTSRKIEPYDQMPDQLLDGERIGHVDLVDQRLDSLPTPSRLSAELECEPPGGPCFAINPPNDWHGDGWGVTVNGKELGEYQGSCQVTERYPNPHAGDDVATHRFAVECAIVGEEGFVHEQRHWRAEIPWLTVPHQEAPPHPAYSMALTWKGEADGAPDWVDHVQVSRVYTGEQHIYFSTDLVHNSVTFQEVVDDTIRFPGGGVHTFHDLTTMTRPVTGDGPREWVWNDRYATVNAVGLRTSRVWCHFHVLYSVLWEVRPFSEVDPNRKFIYRRDVHAFGGAGLVSAYGLESNPFRMPTDGAFAEAVELLLRAAESTGNYATTLAECLFTVEARA